VDDHDRHQEPEQDQEVAFRTLDYLVEDRVAIVTLDRQESLNALDSDSLLELSVAFELAEADIDVRALIVTGAGRAFIAGADVANVGSIDDPYTGREYALSGQDVLNSLAALPFPPVAAIKGLALGGGLELALACDLRVAATGARLGLPEAGLGLVPGFGGTQRLPRLIGQGRALDLIFTARHVEADEALAMGLVDRVVDDALKGARRLTTQILKNAPVALGLAKEAVTRGLGVTLPQGLEIEADLFGLATTTEDFREGTRAFLEKRAAEFKGV
jgi:enoyl-CoA hydratase